MSGPSIWSDHVAPRVQIAPSCVGVCSIVQIILWIGAGSVRCWLVWLLPLHTPGDAGPVQLASIRAQCSLSTSPLGHQQSDRPLRGPIGFPGQPR